MKRDSSNNGELSLHQSQEIAANFGDFSFNAKKNGRLYKQNDFSFGSKSAFMQEEFSILRTNKHSIRQKRILIIDNNQIYHLKQLIE